MTAVENVPTYVPFGDDEYADVVQCLGCGYHGPPELVGIDSLAYSPAGEVCPRCLVDPPANEWYVVWAEESARDVDDEIDVPSFDSRGPDDFGWDPWYVPNGHGGFRQVGWVY